MVTEALGNFDAMMKIVSGGSGWRDRWTLSSKKRKGNSWVQIDKDGNYFTIKCFENGKRRTDLGWYFKLKNDEDFDEPIEGIVKFLKVKISAATVIWQGTPPG